MLNTKKYNDTKNLEFWKKEIVQRDNFHRYLSDLLNDETTNWKELERQLNEWLIFFKKRLNHRDSSPKDKDKYEQAIEQWKHAAILFACAKYAASSGGKKLCKILNLKNPVDKEFIENTEATISRNICKMYENISAECKTHRFKNNYLLLLFYSIIEKTRQNSIKILFVSTKSVHILELIKTNSYGNVGRDPAIFPYVEKYAETSQTFNDSIEAAFILNARHWETENPEDSRFQRFGVVWDIYPLERETSNSIKTSIVGTSAGLSASVGLYNLFQNTYPDDRVLFSAEIEFTVEVEESNRRKVNPTGLLKDVEGISQKLEAAIATDSIDTFVFHEKNFTLDIKRAIDKVRSQGKAFRIKTINSIGEEVEEYPRI